VDLSPSLVVVDEELEAVDFLETAFVGAAVHEDEGVGPSNVGLQLVDEELILLQKDKFGISQNPISR
jgi:hypothetical protein